MYYTTQGLMTAADVAEIRRDMDLDLCGCCEAGTALDADPEEFECDDCSHEYDEHN